MAASDNRTEDSDTSAAALVERLTDAGHILAYKVIVPGPACDSAMSSNYKKRSSGTGA